MKSQIFKIWLIIAVFQAASISQETPSDWFKEYRTVIPGKKYQAGWFHKIFFGSHWRDVWTTPVRVPVVDMEKYGGGLTPLKKGGGLQTKSLRFKGNDGKGYKFRSLDKDPKLTIPKELRESIVYDVMNDQMCSSNPYSAFVVNYLLDAYAIYHLDFSLVFLGDDPALKEFRKEFSNNVGIMEIVPEAVLFEGSDKVIKTVNLLDRLNKEFDESVDAKEFLKARLLDIFTGNWDRHKDQWKWIRFEEGDKKIYKPYPMDFDEAFDYLDGILPFIAAQNVNQLNHFGYNYPNMKFMTWSGRYIDQRFLAFLTKDDWINVTNDVYSKLTDKLIKDAVKKLPPEVYNIAKDELIGKLKSRRGQFKEASEEYYELVNSSVDIYTTDKDDFITIGFNIVTGIDLPADVKENGYTVITIFKREPGAGDNKGNVLRQRIFDNSVTDEIRIYMQDGDDEAVISGKDGNNPTVRIIGGDGKDEIVNRSDETIDFYDDGKKTIVTGDISWDDDKFKQLYEKPLKEYKVKKDILSEEEKDKYETMIGNLKYDPVFPPDKFYFTSFFPIFNYSPDVGPFFGGTFNYLKYGFRMNPYLYKLQFTLGYATAKKDLTGLVADFNSDFRGLVKRSSIIFHLRKSGIEYNNYFGMGNETIYNDSLSKAKYYKVANEKYSGDIGITFPIDKMLRFNIGIIFTQFIIEDKENTASNTVSFSGSDSQKVDLAYIRGGIELDGRDNIIAPYTGYFLSLSGYFSPKLFNDSYEFGRITGDLRGYIGYKTAISLALRAWGEKVIGNSYPFFESAFLGGTKYLRGFSSERFAGDGSLMGAAELRLKLFKYNFLLPQTLGIFGFGETGRVFLKNEESQKWHASYGGGLFMHLIYREITFKLTYAASVDKDYAIYFTTGFGF